MTEKINLFIVAMGDRRTPWYVKLMVIMTLAYIVSPIDLIPDFIPVIGLLDEIIIIPVIYFLVMKLVPEEVKAVAYSNTAEQGYSSNIKILGITIVILLWFLMLQLVYYLVVI